LVGLKVHLVAANLSAHEAGGGQLFQLALRSTNRDTPVPHQLAQVVRLISVAEQPSEDASPRAAEKKNRRIERSG
jgi:hypothetical protein